MATSKPYADPTDERVDSVDTLLGGARALLKSSDEIMTAMAQNASLALSLQCNRDLKSMVKLDRKGTRAAKVLHSLRDDTVPTVIPPTLSSIIDHTVRNTYTDKMTNLRRTNVSERQRELHGKNRALIIMNLGALLTRIGGMHALPVNSIRRGLENKYLGMPTHLWNMSRAYREVPGEPWVDAALAEPPVRAWYPPPREPLSDQIDLSCRDNLEWYRSVKFARHKDGSKLENELLHTVTGEHFYIPKSLVDHMPDPQLGNEWPFLHRYNYQDMVVNGAEMDLILAPLWTKMLALQKDNSMQLMMRPPKEADRKDWGNQATQTRHAPIILEAGTSSYLDNHKIVENVRANRLGKKSVIACDMQTFIRLWWLRHKFPGKYSDIIPLAGEFHGMAHLADGIVILNWTYVLEPILLHFDVKGFHLSLNMKETSQRIRWITLILCAGMEWMRGLFRADEINDIPKLLEKVKANVPVWCFIGFLYYHASMVWGTKEVGKQGIERVTNNCFWRGGQGARCSCYIQVPNQRKVAYVPYM